MNEQNPLFRMTFNQVKTLSNKNFKTTSQKHANHFINDNKCKWHANTNPLRVSATLIDSSITDLKHLMPYLVMLVCTLRQPFLKRYNEEITIGAFENYFKEIEGIISLQDWFFWQLWLEAHQLCLCLRLANCNRNQRRQRILAIQRQSCPKCGGEKTNFSISDYSSSD